MVALVLPRRKLHFLGLSVDTMVIRESVDELTEGRNVLIFHVKPAQKMIGSVTAG